nr:SNF2 domain-containing protein CLASSY 1 [Tanacetum cinerariifolium]
MSDFRIRSRKANLADCTCFLRPGIDVCVNTHYQPPDEESDNEDSEPAWFDAKINSVERKPHEDNKCECVFHNRIVYQIWDSDGEKSLPDSENHSGAINFNFEDANMTPVLIPFSQVDFQEEKKDTSNKEELASLTTFDLMGLRRSKRRNIQPERYLGDDDVSESEVDLS